MAVHKRQLVNLLFSFHRLHQSGYLSLGPPSTAVPATVGQAAIQLPAVQPAVHPASVPPAAVAAAAVHPAAVPSAAVDARAVEPADSRQPSLSQPGPATPQQPRLGLRRGFLGGRPGAAGDAGPRQPVQQQQPQQQQQHASQPQRRTSQRRKSKHLQAAEQELQNWHIILAGEKEALQQHIHDSQEQLHALDQELAAARVRHQQELHQLQQGRESVQAGMQQHQSDLLQVLEQLREHDDQKALLQQQRAELEQQLRDLTVQARVPDVPADQAHAAAAASTPAVLAHPPSTSMRHRARRLRAKQQRQQQHSQHQQQPGPQHQLSRQQQLQHQQQPVGEQQPDPQHHCPVQVVPRRPTACQWPDLPDSEFSISYQAPQDQHAHALADEAATAAHSANLAAADHQTWSEVVLGEVTEDETEAVTTARSAAFGEEEWLYEQGVYDGFSSEEYEGLEGDPLSVGPPINPVALRAANTAVLRGDYYWGGPNPFVFGGYRNMLEYDDAKCPSDSTDMSE